MYTLMTYTLSKRLESVHNNEVACLLHLADDLRCRAYFRRGFYITINLKYVATVGLTLCS